VDKNSIIDNRNITDVNSRRESHNCKDVSNGRDTNNSTNIIRTPEAAEMSVTVWIHATLYEHAMKFTNDSSKG
jgi:hypothetical protein